MKDILAEILIFVFGLILLIPPFMLIVFINLKCLDEIMVLWPGRETFTYCVMLPGIYFLVFSAISIIVAPFVSIYQYRKGKIKEKFDILLNFLGGICVSFWASLIMASAHILWVVIFTFFANAFSSDAKEYIDEQYRKYHKIPVLFTKEKISVDIIIETRSIYNDTELKYWTSESLIENDGINIENYPISYYEVDPIFLDDAQIDLDKPLEINYCIEISDGKQKISKLETHNVKLNYDDFKNGQRYTIKSILYDKNNYKAKFVTEYKFRLELPIEIAKDYINPFKDIEFVEIEDW